MPLELSPPSLLLYPLCNCGRRGINTEHLQCCLYLSIISHPGTPLLEGRGAPSVKLKPAGPDPGRAQPGKTLGGEGLSWPRRTASLPPTTDSSPHHHCLGVLTSTPFLESKNQPPAGPSGMKRSAAFCARAGALGWPRVLGATEIGAGHLAQSKQEERQGGGPRGAREKEAMTAAERSRPLPGPPDLPLTLPRRLSRYKPPWRIKGSRKGKQKNTPFPNK